MNKNTGMNMPNWTQSTIEIEGPKEEMSLFMQSIGSDCINLDNLISIISKDKKEFLEQLCLSNQEFLEISDINIENPSKLTLEAESIWGTPINFFKNVSLLFQKIDFKIYFEQVEADKCGYYKIKNGNLAQIEKRYSERYGVNFSIDKNLLIKEKDSIVINIISQEKKNPKNLYSEESKDICWRCEIPEIFLEKILDYQDFFTQSHITHDDNYKRVSLEDYPISNIFDFKEKIYKTVLEERENLNFLFRQLQIEQSLPLRKKGKVIHKI